MRKITDYAIVVVSHFARHPASAMHTARSVAEATRVPQPTVAKILKRLTRTGMMRSTRGLCGGYALIQPPDQISLVEIIEAMEGPLALTECSHPPSGSCNDEHRCSLSGHWPRINVAVRTALAQITLSELCAPTNQPQLEA